MMFARELIKLAGCLGSHKAGFWACPRTENHNFLSNLFQCSTTLSKKKCFLMFRQNFLCISLCSLPPGLSLDTTEKTLTLFLLLLIRTPIYMHWWNAHTHFLKFISSRPNNLSFLSLFLFILGSPGLVTPLQMWSHQCWVVEGSSPLTCCKCPS